MGTVRLLKWLVMRYSDLLCLPSYMEGRPNVVNEAMASALPVIATRIGGIPDMVEEGKTAFLHDPATRELRGHIGNWSRC
jgi:glycosyltransferase involved in cell wall biosynthesis